jgi:hypothetical protein
MKVDTTENFVVLFDIYNLKHSMGRLVQNNQKCL